MKSTVIVLGFVGCGTFVIAMPDPCLILLDSTFFEKKHPLEPSSVLPALYEDVTAHTTIFPLEPRPQYQDKWILQLSEYAPLAMLPVKKLLPDLHHHRLYGTDAISGVTTWVQMHPP